MFHLLIKLLLFELLCKVKIIFLKTINFIFYRKNNGRLAKIISFSSNAKVRVCTLKKVKMHKMQKTSKSVGVSIYSLYINHLIAFISFSV